jgi:hypothetical protein
MLLCNNTVATLSNDHGIFACRDSKTSEECCNAIENLLANLYESGETSWCIDNFSPSLCRLMIAHVPLHEHPWHALFLSSNQIQPKDHDDGVEWRQYTNGIWKDGLISSPFLFNETTEKDSFFSAILSSALSETGGMHRLMHHSIAISCPHGVAGPFQVSITMLLFVSEHFFVDVDDPFDTFGENEFFLSNSRIDIEQPAFASPQHVVAVQIIMKERAVCNDDSQIEFATKLHVRYPPLTHEGNLQVALLAPLLYQGWLTSKNINYTLTPWSSYQTPMQTRVTTGFEQDYYWVGIITILWSLRGSYLLLCSLSKVSKWN